MLSDGLSCLESYLPLEGNIYNTCQIPPLAARPIQSNLTHAINSNSQRSLDLIVLIVFFAFSTSFFMMLLSKAPQIVYELSKLILLEESPGCLQ